MKTRALEDSTVTEVQLTSLEKQLGTRLPTDYRNFLLENNGVELLNQSFFVQDLDQEIKLQVFFGLHNVSSRGLTLTYWLDEYEDELDPDTLLIGKDRGGNFLLYTIAGEDQGIYYWDTRNFFPQSADGGEIRTLWRTTSLFSTTRYATIPQLPFNLYLRPVIGSVTGSAEEQPARNTVAPTCLASVAGPPSAA